MTPTEIKALRLSRGLTQTELATLCGVGQPMVMKWERGERNPSRQSQMLLRQVASQGTAADQREA